MFTQKRKTKEELEKDALEFSLFQEGIDKKSKQATLTSKKALRNFWQEEPVDENEKFLRNFIVNKGSNRMPHRCKAG